MAWSPRTIVVGVDGSEQSVRAAEVAASLARAHGARLLVATVVRPPEGWWGLVGSPPPADALGDALAKAQAEVLDDVVGGLDLDGIEHDTVEEIGDPAAALSNLCASENADVLVVGRRGAGLVERLVMGSVADRAVKLAPCPVLVVP